MRILEYTGLDTSRVQKSYEKVRRALEANDFSAAQVKKLSNLSHGKFYRARLDDSNRILFSLVRYGNEVCALVLEVIANHDYNKSRFLRGAHIEEAKIPECNYADSIGEAEPLRYLHPERASVHLLDKAISFDDAQDAIFRLPSPLIVIGSAGSGKTALTLEKLKNAEGEVLYVTHSAYLAQSARDLYYCNGFERVGQEASFLSYREFLETIQVPLGREAQWRDFDDWFARMKQAHREVDAHQAFEEIRGVIVASAGGVLSREAYRALGIRQSIYAEDLRDEIYDLFEKYRGWLQEAKLYDLNLVAQEWKKLAHPRYDFVVIDEVQDITPAQLALVLKTLKRPNHFLLCGDSNQIVHPNFFSWSQVKSLFWENSALADKQELRVLSANFRNGQRTTQVANQLLKIKHSRFGSIDRESNYLVQAVGGDVGTVELVLDKDSGKKDLDQNIRRSTQFAVLVMRDEDKAEARKHFSTPLLFSIHEAKGLEYENIVLYRFVSDHRADFAEIVAGVSREDLQTEQLEYRRAKDKSDKSLEIYKFFVNALYVALTRAIRNIYIIESDVQHQLFDLLGLSVGAPVQVQTKQSTMEDWQKEARKLELQGKQEQADAIRRSILKEVPVPWPVFDQARTEELLLKVFREQAPGSKFKQQLFEIATCHDTPMVAAYLASDAKFEPANRFLDQRPALGRKTYAHYAAHNFKDILRQCDAHGVEHRLPMNLTPLMAAAASGNVPLAQALIERGADREATDHFGSNALHWAMREAFRDQRFAEGPFGALYECLAPASIDIKTGDRLVRIDRHVSEYFLFQTLWALFKSRFTHQARRPLAAFEAQAILEVWQQLPANVVPVERNKRQHLNGVLARNEVERDYAYNRALFMRVAQGWYQLNPKLSIRKKVNGVETWIPIYQALALSFVNEFAWDFTWDRIDAYLELAGLGDRTIPIAAERALARHQAAELARERKELEWRQAAEKLRAQRELELQQRAAEPPKWGTPAARRAEIERVRREIEARKRQ